MHDLQNFVLREICGRRGKGEDALVVRRLAQEMFEKLRTLEPPMTEQLGVERTDDDWINRHLRAERFKLADAVGQEIGGVRIRCELRPRTMVKLLVLGAPGDAVVFETGEFPLSIRAEERTQVVEAEIVADIPAPIAGGRVTRLSLFRAPDLPTRIAVAREDGRPFRRVARGVNGEARLRFAEHHTVCIEHEPFQVGLAQIFLNSRKIGAFGEPDPRGRAAKAGLVVVASDLDLRPH